MPTADINEVRERTAKRRAGQKMIDKFAAPEAAPEFEHVKKEMHKRLPDVAEKKMPHVSTGAYDPAMRERPEDVEVHKRIAAAEPAPKAKRQRQVRTDSFVFSMRIPAKYERVLTLEALDELDAGTFVKGTKRETKLEYLEHIMFEYLENAYKARPNPKAKG